MYWNRSNILLLLLLVKYTLWGYGMSVERTPGDIQSKSDSQGTEINLECSTNHNRRMGGKRKNIEIRSKSSKENLYVGEKFDIPEGVFPSDQGEFEPKST